MDRATARDEREHRGPPARIATDASADGTGPAGRWAVAWGVLDAVGVLAVTAVVAVALVFGVAVLAALELAPGALGPALMPLPLVTLGVVTVVWVHVRYRAAGRLTGPASAGVRDWLTGVAWGVGAFLLVNIGLALVLQVLAGLFGVELPRPQEGVRQAAQNPALVPWLLVSAVVVAPLAEEVFFRGLLYPALRRRLRVWGAVAVSAVAFAAAHVVQELDGQAGPVAFVLILPLGVLLGWLYERHGSLAVPIAVHAAFNLSVSVLMLGGP